MVLLNKTIKIGDKIIGKEHPCFIIGEIGINHNGSIEIAKKLIEIAKNAGCDAVKFQKRTVNEVYTKEELALPRASVFGETNGDLKYGLEFQEEEYRIIDNYCKERDIIWFASCWDKKSVDFMEKFDIPCYKIASALLTDLELLKYIKSKNKPILLSTGMSTLEQIDKAVEILDTEDLILYHCTSTYPTDSEEINLKVIPNLESRYNTLVGYSGHERGIMPSVLACACGAISIERHITTDRTLWGSDQAASLEPTGLQKLVRDIRQVPVVLGDGKKIVYENEYPIIKKLRKEKIINAY